MAYGIISATLTLNVRAIPKKANPIIWNVGFEPGIVEAIKSGEKSVECGQAIVDKDSVSLLYTRLTTLNDKCTYKLTIKNIGDTAALLSAITPIEPSKSSCDIRGQEMTCGNITYKLTTDATGNKLLTNNRTLAPYTGTLDIYLVAAYDGVILGENEGHATAGFKLTYTQQ